MMRSAFFRNYRRWHDAKSSFPKLIPNADLTQNRMNILQCLQKKEKDREKDCFLLEKHIIRVTVRVRTERRAAMKLKLEDIARATGYSITTVSRALNGSSSISEKTRLQILETARKTGYLQSGRTIALTVPRIDLAYYYKDMIERLENMIQFAGFRMELIPLCDLELIEEHKPTAVISLVGEDKLERYWGKKYEIPLICLNAVPRHLDGIFSVCSNEKQGMSLLLEHLLSLGHRRIGLFGTGKQEALTHSSALKERKDTFQKILSEQGLPDSLMVGYPGNEQEYAGTVYRLLDKGVTAIVALAEGQIMRILYYLKQAGVRVPEEVSLTGWLSEMDFYCDPQLTGVMQNYDYLAQHALVMLNRLLHREEIKENVTVDYNFFLRRSTAPPEMKK